MAEKQKYTKQGFQELVDELKYLKLTTAHYFPPCGEGYDGIGITPHVVVALSEEALTYNINLLPDDKDNQLAAALEAMK